MSTISLILSHLEAGNHQYQVLQLEPLEVWYHRGIGVGLDYLVFLHALFIPIIMLFIYFFILWIMFLSVVETLVIVSGG